MSSTGRPNDWRKSWSRPVSLNSQRGTDQPGQRKQEETEDEFSDAEEIPREPAPEQDDIASTSPHPEPETPPSRPRTPAYVAPIPKIGPISPIPSLEPSSSRDGASVPIQPPPTRPRLPPFVGSFLMGKRVDEYGDIVDDKTGQVVAHAGGDLPAMVGRAVSNRQGDILGDDGELLGYVADLEIEKKGGSGSNAQSPQMSRPRNLFEVMGRTAGLMVDHQGNILDASGNVVGKFHDNNNPLHRKEREEREAREAQARAEGKKPEEQGETKGKETDAEARDRPGTGREHTEEQAPGQEQDQEEQPGERSRPRRSESERRRNAESWRKERPDESPSDIFLDVKSTTEGIQLTIRIPTVFNGRQVKPNISFS